MSEGVRGDRKCASDHHPALSDDQCHGQRALRAAQEQLSAEEIERHEEEDATLE